jgi:hypothetical protein
LGSLQRIDFGQHMLSAGMISRTPCQTNGWAQVA